MFNLGMGEITVILLLALIFLGPGKLPDLAAGLGKIIKEIRKATSDVKNEIALDDSFRKPFEELRDAVTLHPDELKRRDEIRKFHEEAAKRAAEEAEKTGIDTSPAAELPNNEPPDGLASPVKALGVTQPAGPNDTIIQPAPNHATLDDIPTPPPEAPLPPLPTGGTPAKGTPAVAKGMTPPLGTIARPNTLRGVKPVPVAAPPPPPPPAAPANGESPTANITQILKEEDLMPGGGSGKPPPPPPLPGLRPAGTPRPPSAAPPLPPNPLDSKKKT